MQDATLEFVLHSEAIEAGAMSNAPENPDSDKSASVETDEQLMGAISRGATDSLSVLFLRYKQPLFGFFRRRVADPAQAEELTQETFLALIRASARYQPTALFRTWLYAIGFKILRAYRRKAASRATFLRQQPPDLEMRLREPAAHGDLGVEVLIRHAVGKLERIDREVLLLREFEQLSYAEIAGLLRLPLNTVRSRLFRARTALHDLLAAPAPHPPSSTLAQPEEQL